MTTILMIVFATTLFIFFAKKPIWRALPIADKISYKESFFYWFTASDLAHPKFKPFRLAIVINNILNVVMAIVCVLLIIGVIIKFFAFIS